MSTECYTRACPSLYDTGNLTQYVALYLVKDSIGPSLSAKGIPWNTYLIYKKCQASLDTFPEAKWYQRSRQRTDIASAQV